MSVRKCSACQCPVTQTVTGLFPLHPGVKWISHRKQQIQTQKKRKTRQTKKRQRVTPVGEMRKRDRKPRCVGHKQKTDSEQKCRNKLSETHYRWEVTNMQSHANPHTASQA